MFSERPSEAPSRTTGTLSVHTAVYVVLQRKGSACKSSANLDDIAVSKTPVYTATLDSHNGVAVSSSVDGSEHDCRRPPCGPRKRLLCECLRNEVPQLELRGRPQG